MGRSQAEHDTLFGVIDAAFQNWPESHPFRPTDAEHLRAWLAIEVGHTEALEVPGLSPEQIVQLGLFFSGGQKRFRVGRCGETLVVLRPLTMKKRELPVDDFRAMAERIYALIEDVTGITVESYKASKGHEQPVHARAPQALHRTGEGRGLCPA